MTDIPQLFDTLEANVMAMAPPLPKALTLQQPWAGAIFRWGKDVENRRWHTRYRGPLLIHTSKRSDPTGHAYIRNIVGPSKKLELGDPSAWTEGVIIGVVDLVDCVQNHPSIWTAKNHYQLVLLNPREAVPPLPCRGSLGFWQPPEHIVCAVMNRLAPAGLHTGDRRIS
jgi:hypothetical protein